MTVLARLALQVVLVFLLLSVVVGLASGETAWWARIVLVALGLGALWLAPRVRGLGRPPGPPDGSR